MLALRGIGRYFRLASRAFIADCSSTIAVIFAVSLVPVILVVMLAVQYGFYIQARSQLNLAADAAALHAVRVASQAYANGYVTIAAEQAAGQAAGQQWFAAQLGTLAPATNATPTVTVTYQNAPGSFTAVVSYTASLPTGFGGLIPATLQLSGSSTSTVQSGFLEVLLMVDNSSSMLIGSTTADMLALEQATPCSTQSAQYGPFTINNRSATLDTSIYGWVYNTGSSRNGYANAQNNYSPTLPPTSYQQGSCSNGGYDGPASLCFYMPTTISTISATTGKCTNGGGSNLSDQSAYGEPINTPQAPCSFACHSSGTNNDYFGLARSLVPAVTLRLDVVHNAAESVITTLQNAQQTVGQFSVGYYEFNNDVTKVYPTSGEAGTNLATALADVQVLNPPVTPISLVYNTDFATSMSDLNNQVTAAGNGLSASAPLKTLLIVTDGLNDVTSAQNTGPMTSASNEQICQQFKNKGFTVYVLYTDYLPFPASNYSAKVQPYIEPTSGNPIQQALQACSSGSGYYFEASDPTGIQNAMQSMVQSAMNTPGRVTN